MRGIVVAGVVRALRGWCRQQGVPAPPGVHPHDAGFFRSERVMANSWYPYEQHLRLVRLAYLHVVGADTDAFRRFCSAGALRAYAGEQRELIYPNEPGASLANINALWRACHNFGNPRPRVLASGEGTVAFNGVEHMTAFESEINLGWISGILEAAGAKHVSAEMVTGPKDGTDVALGRFRWQ